MSSEFLLALAIGIVLGAAIIVSGMVHGYVSAVIKHGKEHHGEKEL